MLWVNWNVDLLNLFMKQTNLLSTAVIFAIANEISSNVIPSVLFFSQPQTNQEKINAIKASKHYSKSFKILLMSTTRRKNDAIDSSVSEMSDAKHVQNGNGRAKPLRQYLHDVVQVETEAAQNRIEQYAKEQNALLKLFREKAEQDFDEILR